MQEKTKIQADWWSKSLSGAILGFTLAILLSGIFAWAGYGGIDAPAKVQFNMWIISPIWLLVLSFVYLFQSGKSAFFWLLACNIIAWLILSWVKH
ncbi:hypothetical protein [uncultured Shewanella sp.]|uniref:hypothetical protein n=1 Tax=uncultured Shewanella sp. TaxID=173975 RepID=UPI00261205EA|nr:hypothetical protein [uncultured Shewanella sp.]